MFRLYIVMKILATRCEDLFYGVFVFTYGRDPRVLWIS